MDLNEEKLMMERSEESESDGFVNEEDFPTVSLRLFCELVESWLEVNGTNAFASALLDKRVSQISSSSNNTKKNQKK